MNLDKFFQEYAFSPIIAVGIVGGLTATYSNADARAEFGDSVESLVSNTVAAVCSYPAEHQDVPTFPTLEIAK